MATERQGGKGIDRRTLLIGGGAGLGLIVAWAVWPRSYRPNLSVREGETAFGAWLKIATDGQVTVAIPQCEYGQGVFTTLPQLIADELGADWRTVGVEQAPLNPIYANSLAAAELFPGVVPDQLRRTHAVRTALMLTGGSTSMRSFEAPLRRAGAAARAMLCQAAARRWGIDWRACATAGGFVIHGQQRLRFGELAADAAGESVPRDLPLREGETARLAGEPLPRLDAPAKVDGSANFAADIRLPGMVFAAIRQGPVGTRRLVGADEAAASRVPGMLHVVKNERWIAAVANNWWAASRALDALKPRFEVTARLDSATIQAALDAALDGPGSRIVHEGDLAPVFRGARVVTAEYRAGVALHAAVEPMTATALWEDGRLRLWLPTQAPGLARGAVARLLGIGEGSVTIHPVFAGGSFGQNLEHQAAEQAALIARELGKPVQLSWSRGETMIHDRVRAPAAARMSARLGGNGAVAGWLAKIAAPSSGHELARRLMAGDSAIGAGLAIAGTGDPAAVEGARPPYRIPNLAIDHHPADIGLPTGYWRGGAHGVTAFFTESFIDELAHVAEIEAFSFRIAMLGGEPRLARCLSTVTSLGGWQGGTAGSGQGLACHAFRGSYIAVMAEASVGDDQRVQVDRLVAAVDCGRVVNPDVVQQQIEGGLIFGLAAATGATTGFTDNMAEARRFSDLGLPRLADTPDIMVELVASEADPGGVSELAVPPVAPAIANALFAATGVRLRQLPLIPGGE
ncbi:molybdopterin cofactor-binding domain-containing protein [Sphingomonas sp.]|uniref:xanthine dehydrogenase family protein molybdopterin-binding subunit n=1 Tax=Sphingomonas sp. TaxID=28214 RepID=UPI001EC222DA|nr:molybdopterin cofactor-binding domain-containing protein [Sphingomonas sp.]MBX3593431.1 xanthine dehydrogenase family protein molybdopterin-binding subunit [Sphingomonas sp.]